MTAYFSNSTGVFTAPSYGVYQCCMSARCKPGGFCEFTLSRTGLKNRVAAMGTPEPGRRPWFPNFFNPGGESYSICTLQRMGRGATIQMNLESEGRNDCIEETGWHYTRFSCLRVMDLYTYSYPYPYPDYNDEE